MTTGKYWVVLPDPGEYQRALGTGDEMMFAVPANKMKTLIAGLTKNENGAFAYGNHHPFMQPDFPSPISTSRCSSRGAWTQGRSGWTRQEKWRVQDLLLRGLLS